MKDGLYYVKVHGYDTYVKVIDGEPNILQRKKSELVWTPTVLDPARAKRLILTKEEELVSRASKVI